MSTHRAMRHAMSLDLTALPFRAANMLLIAVVTDVVGFPVDVEGVVAEGVNQ